tara:strand:+ start:16956 stop:17339 length:384 start_codon:yes stop_codon:yes gene_type:complete
MDELSCGASIYNPDTSNRQIMDCEIILSAEAVEVLKSLRGDKDSYLYISVNGGGCSGYIYDLQLLEDEPTDSHQVITQDGIGVVIHELDSSLLNGVLIDYEDKLMGGGFKMSNPNAKRACGCGLSFG